MFCLHKKKIESLETVHLCCLQKDNVFSLPGHLADQREEEQTKVLSILPQKHFQTEKEFSFHGTL